ncbi:MAG: hypothetical protein HY074_10970 [Deltaproteobacteria bacterium]|nr:hypothetical protein [Deltaproteobacteria bacterium]
MNISKLTIAGVLALSAVVHHEALADWDKNNGWLSYYATTVTIEHVGTSDDFAPPQLIGTIALTVDCGESASQRDLPNLMLSAGTAVNTVFTCNSRVSHPPTIVTAVFVSPALVAPIQASHVELVGPIDRASFWQDPKYEMNVKLQFTLPPVAKLKPLTIWGVIKDTKGTLAVHESFTLCVIPHGSHGDFTKTCQAVTTDQFGQFTLAHTFTTARYDDKIFSYTFGLTGPYDSALEVGPTRSKLFGSVEFSTPGSDQLLQQANLEFRVLAHSNSTTLAAESRLIKTVSVEASSLDSNLDSKVPSRQRAIR